jgi:hypothetical protein
MSWRRTREWTYSSTKLNLGIILGELSVAPLFLFTSEESAADTHWIEGWASSRVGLDVTERRKMLASFGNWTPVPLAFESNNFSDSQDTICTLWNLKGHYRVHRSLPLDSIGRQIYIDHILLPLFCKIHFNPICYSSPGVPFRLPTRTVYAFLTVIIIPLCHYISTNEIIHNDSCHTAEQELSIADNVINWLHIYPTTMVANLTQINTIEIILQNNRWGGFFKLT